MVYRVGLEGPSLSVVMNSSLKRGGGCCRKGNSGE